jgi:hypothetical protein
MIQEYFDTYSREDSTAMEKERGKWVGRINLEAGDRLCDLCRRLALVLLLPLELAPRQRLDHFQHGLGYFGYEDMIYHAPQHFAGLQLLL